MSSVLLSFSGGLDSLAAAIVLKKQGYDVTLGHINWLINGTNFGEAQTVAAYNLAEELGMPLEVLAYMGFPETSFAKYSWVPVCISTIMHHAGDPCVYPARNVRRYDSVAFGLTMESTDHIKQNWVAAIRDYVYDGEVLFPIGDLLHNDRVTIVPQRLRDMTVCCYLGPSAEEPCGVCWKCTGGR